MDLFKALRIGHLAKQHETLVRKLEFLRTDRFLETMDVSSLTVIGEPLPAAIEVEVQCAIRNALDRHLVRQLGETASTLRDLGVEA